MPKYVVHVHVMEKASERLFQEQFMDARPMVDHRDIAVVGAIGPDLFFWAPDYEICRIMLRILEAYDEIRKLYDATIGKIADAIEAVEEAVEDMAERIAPHTASIVEAVIREAKETAEMFESTLKRGALAAALGLDDLVADLGDMPTVTKRIFDLFKPPLQDGKPEAQWYWFDMLHYRQTGDFARNLLENATTPMQKAYAYGYLTHIATDVVGHGYVNQVVGGPYRTHVQRHVTVENFIDAWAFREYYGGDISTGLVDMLSLPDQLPEEVVDLLCNAFRQTYRDKPHPALLPGDGFLTKEHIRQTYTLFKRVTELLEDHIEPPEEPFTGVLDAVWEALKDAFKPPPEPPEVGDGDCGVLDYLSFGLTEKSRECYRSLVESIKEWLEYLAELMEWILEETLALFDFLLSSLLLLPAMAIIGILYLIQLGLYRLLLLIRDQLALHGLTYPSHGLLDTAHGRNLTTPYQCGYSLELYPAVYSADENCLQCPSHGPERPQTLPASYQELASPQDFIEGAPVDLKALHSYANAQTPQETRNLYLEFGGIAAPGQQRFRQIASAVELAVWMIKNWKKNPDATTNWNLDSDRGYAYKQWTGRLPTSPPDHTVEGESYI